MSKYALGVSNTDELTALEGFGVSVVERRSIPGA